MIFRLVWNNQHPSIKFSDKIEHIILSNLGSDLNGYRERMSAIFYDQYEPVRFSYKSYLFHVFEYNDADS